MATNSFQLNPSKPSLSIFVLSTFLRSQSLIFLSSNSNFFIWGDRLTNREDLIARKGLGFQSIASHITIMFSRMFGKPKQETNAVATLDKLNETLEMLEKKEKVLLKKVAAEVEKAKEFTRGKNKRAAIQCLKRKRLYEQQIEQLGNFQLRIHDQMIMLEGAKATTETVDALRTGAAAMKAMQKATNIDDVDKTMDEINEQTENMKQIQDALSAPIGAAADFDEDELEAELEELEGAELEEQLLQPATTAPAAPVQVPAGQQPTRPVPAKRTPEEDELAALQAEMAL
ncbi:Vacuolar protein sorting-associated protein 32 2 [Glycine soja]